MSADGITESGKLSLKLFVVLSRALESIEKQVEADVKRYDLNLSEFAVLELLYNKGKQPIQVIGKKVLLASSSITYVVDKLEKKELLERHACPKDRRVIYGCLTVEGEKLMEEIFPQHVEAIEAIFQGITDEEKKIAIDLLKKLGYFAAAI